MFPRLFLRRAAAYKTLKSLHIHIHHYHLKPAHSGVCINFGDRMKNCVFLSKRFMGGYIEDAQIASLGLEIYQDIFGPGSVPDFHYVIPHDDDQWPVHLWGYELGVGVETHIKKFLSNSNSSISVSNEIKKN